MVDDLVAGPAVSGLADVAVAERGSAQDVDRSAAGAVGLAAPVALDQLGFLVLGEHALELDQQLVLGAVTARALDELDPHPGPGEFLQQQRLVGELAGQPVRRIHQHHVHAPLGHQVTQRLQGRAHQRGARMTLVFEDPLRRDVKPGLRGVLAQRRGLRPDRLVFLLPGTGDPGVDRRACHGAAFLPGQAARCGPAAAVPIWRRPPTNRWRRDGRRRTPSRPPGRSPAGMVSAAPRQELVQRLRHDGGDRPPRHAGMLPDGGREPGRHLDREHHGGLGNRDPSRMPPPDPRTGGPAAASTRTGRPAPGPPQTPARPPRPAPRPR